MFELSELEFIKRVLKDSESQDEITLNIIEKIEKIVSECSNNRQCLWSFYWDCGRQGEVEGLFKATKEEVQDAVGRKVYFGEILGKHSEVYGVIEEGDITLESQNPLEVINAKESGYNPLEYIQYECKVCGSTYSVEDMNEEHDICDYCARKQEEERNE